MFGVTIINNSGLSVQLIPNGNVADGPRHIVLEGYPVPLTIRDASGNIPQSRVEIFNGQRTYQLSYEGTGQVTVTIEAHGAFTASTGLGSPVSGSFVAPVPTLPAVSGFSWSPRNPVYVGNVMRLSWSPVPGATSYDVQLMRNGNTIITTSVTTNLFTHQLTNDDMFRRLSATVRARSSNALAGPRATTPNYYVGNSFG